MIMDRTSTRPHGSTRCWRSLAFADVRIVITGARGFVGRTLAETFSCRGAETIGIDREVDVTDPDALVAALADARPDALVHLAAQSSVAASIEDPNETFRVNVLGTQNVLRALGAIRPGARALIVTSGQIYATTPGAPAREGDPLVPSSPYAWSKVCADKLAARFAATHSLHVIRARPFNHSGPGRAPHFVESSLAKQLVEIERGERKPELQIGNPDSVRDFLDVRDVASAYWSMLEGPVPAGAYNVASGRGWSIEALVAALLELCEAPDPIRVIVADHLWRPTDHAVGSSQKLRDSTGWEPRIDFGETLAALLNDWRRQLAT
jgi:GDP-4-dehydro-6-deoxy-D-mannose reductase